MNQNQAVVIATVNLGLDPLDPLAKSRRRFGQQGSCRNCEANKASDKAPEVENSLTATVKVFGAVIACPIYVFFADTTIFESFRILLDDTLVESSWMGSKWSHQTGFHYLLYSALLANEMKDKTKWFPMVLSHLLHLHCQLLWPQLGRI